MAFVLKTKNQILRDILARTVSRSDLNGIRKNSGLYHVAASSADEDAEQYLQLALLRDVFSIDNATGSELDERAAEMATDEKLKRYTANKATTYLQFSRVGTTGTTNVNQGSFASASDAQGLITFQTTIAGSIPNGQSVSGLIPAIALVAGVRGNVAANTIRRMTTRIPGITAVTNPTAVDNGRDRESDPNFRKRLKAHVQSMSRGTPFAQESFAGRAVLANGARVLFVRFDTPVIPTGFSDLYLDDGTGALDVYDSSYLVTPDVLVVSATGTEDRLRTTQRPIREDGSFVLYYDGVAQAGPIYAVNFAKGDIQLYVPPGAGQKVSAGYRYYTGLVQEAQKILHGDPNDRQTYPGVVAGGLTTRAKPASRALQSVQGQIVSLDDYDVVAVIEAASTAIQVYINELGIGEPVLVAEIYRVVQSTKGVRNFKLTALSGSNPPVDQVILRNQVPRIMSSAITLV